jgi:hypothetical protein
VLGTLLVPFGLGSGVAFFYAARRAGGVRAWERAGALWFGLSLAGYLVALAMKDREPVAHALGLAAMFAGWGGAFVHAMVIRPEYVRRVAPRVATAQERADVAEARRIAREEPRLAVELGIGRPDRDDAYDAGLVDVNHASARALEELPGVGPVLAAADRERARGVRRLRVGRRARRAPRARPRDRRADARPSGVPPPMTGAGLQRDDVKPWWVWLTAVPLGFGVGPGFLYAAVRSRSVSYAVYGVLWLAVCLTGLVLTLVYPEDSDGDGFGSFLMVMTWIAGFGQAFLLRGNYVRRVRARDADPILRARERLHARDEARRIAARPAARARDGHRPPRPGPRRRRRAHRRQPRAHGGAHAAAGRRPRARSANREDAARDPRLLLAGGHGHRARPPARPGRGHARAGDLRAARLIPLAAKV